MKITIGMQCLIVSLLQGLEDTHTPCIRQYVLIPNALVILCFIEVNFGIVCASVPTVRPFFSRFIPVLLSRRKHTDSGASGPNDRTADTVEKMNRERKNLKHRNNNVPDESYNMSSFGSNMSRYHDGADEESQLWPSSGPSKTQGFGRVTETA